MNKDIGLSTAVLFYNNIGPQNGVCGNIEKVHKNLICSIYLCHDQHIQIRNQSFDAPLHNEFQDSNFYTTILSKPTMPQIQSLGLCATCP